MFLVLDNNNYGIRFTPHHETNSIEFTLEPTHQAIYYKVENNNIIFDEDKYNKDRREQLSKKLTKRYRKFIQKAPYLIDKDLQSQEQIESYKIKYEQALAGSVEFFTEEANALGISPDDLLALVLQLGNDYKVKYDNLIAKAEATRVSTNKLIKVNLFDEALKALQFAKQITVENATTLTMQDFLNYVTGGKAVLEYINEKTNNSNN